MANAWTEEEVQATIKSYFQMLELELNDEKYNKAKFRKDLLLLVTSRSAGSIEFKHQNISAVLDDMGREYIKGYKPLKNYQKSLKDAVIAFTETAN